MGLKGVVVADHQLPQGLRPVIRGPAAEALAPLIPAAEPVALPIEHPPLLLAGPGGGKDQIQRAGEEAAVAHGQLGQGRGVVGAEQTFGMVAKGISEVAGAGLLQAQVEVQLIQAPAGGQVSGAKGAEGATEGAGEHLPHGGQEGLRQGVPQARAPELMGRQGLALRVGQVGGVIDLLQQAMEAVAEAAPGGEIGPQAPLRPGGWGGLGLGGRSGGQGEGGILPRVGIPDITALFQGFDAQGFGP